MVPRLAGTYVKSLLISLPFTRKTKRKKNHFMHFIIWISTFSFHSVHFTLCISLYAFQSLHFLYAFHSKFDICFFYFVLTALWWFFSKRWIDHFEDTKSIVMNYFMYTLKFDNSPCGEISTSPTQRCVLQTGSHTSHDSMFRWSKCFKEART